MNELTTIGQSGSGFLTPRNMAEAMELAKFMATANLVPTHLQRQPGNCLLVIEQAMRWRMSPFAVAQCTSVIHGKLGFEGKLVAAAVETSGVIDGGFDYEFSGVGDERTITVRATRRGEKEPREVKVRLKDAVTENGIWKKQPDQQLVYHGSRVWARRWAPAVMLGVNSPEEFTGTTIEGTVEPSPSLGSQSTAGLISDAVPDFDGPEYPLATNAGGRIYRSRAEWTHAWLGEPSGLVPRMVKAGALDKLQAALAMNKGAFAQVREHDAEAVAEVESAIIVALAPLAVREPGEDG